MMSRLVLRSKRSVWLGAVVLVALMLVWTLAAARPGGGGSYSGGGGSSRSSGGGGSSWSSSGGSSGSSGSSGGGPARPMSSFERICWIAFVVVLVMVGYLPSLIQASAEWTTGSPEPEEENQRSRYRSVQEAIVSLQGTDPNFSQVLLEDFLYCLYAEVQRSRALGLERLGAYVTPPARRAYSPFACRSVQDIVVGAMVVESVRASDPPVRQVEMTVRFEVNYTEYQADGAAQSYYARERWRLTRSPDAVSRTPERARVIGCPHCGAPLEQTLGGTCRYCGQTPQIGQFDWSVLSVVVEERTPRGPMLTGTTEEAGTDLPTVYAPDLPARLAELMSRDPSVTGTALQKRLHRIFHTFQAAWSNQDLTPMRPYLSDFLFQTQSYWVRAYRDAGLINRTDQSRILEVQFAKVVRDAYFDAITVRMFATGLDVTVDRQSGKVVGGNAQRERTYSEYWTLIRGVNVTGAPRETGDCPNCGAPTTQINMAGQCTHCNAHVTAGEFDWVLSRIEQDDSYEG